MVRIGIQQGLDDGLLGDAIHFADKIRVGFSRYGKVIDLVGRTVNQVTGATRGLHRDVEHGMHNWYDLFNERPPHNYCACSYGVKKQLKILMYTKYIPVFRYFLP